MYISELSSCKSFLFSSKIITKIVFVDFFFNVGISHYPPLFFSPSSSFSLCRFQNYSFCLDAALKNLFSIAGCMKVLKAKGVDSCICGFSQFANCRTLEKGKLNFEVWSLNEVDGNQWLTYTALPISSCPSLINTSSCIMKIIQNAIPKIRVAKMLLQWVAFLYPIYCLVACLKVVQPKISKDNKTLLYHRVVLAWGQRKSNILI